MKKIVSCAFMASIIATGASAGEKGHDAHSQVSDNAIAKQREMLAKNTLGQGFGPQSPRDIDASAGDNNVAFNMSPAYTEMNLCNIHFHKNAEHKGGEFNTYVGNGDGHGYQSGFKYSGKLSPAELKPVGKDICPSKHGGLAPGDTIEFH